MSNSTGITSNLPGSSPKVNMLADVIKVTEMSRDELVIYVIKNPTHYGETFAYSIATLYQNYQITSLPVKQVVDMSVALYMASAPSLTSMILDSKVRDQCVDFYMSLIQLLTMYRDGNGDISLSKELLTTVRVLRQSWGM